MIIYKLLFAYIIIFYKINKYKKIKEIPELNNFSRFKYNKNRER